ncbi:MAG TPA: zinc-dependent metalloprotease [Granulicella sp.]|nr:zinc-dependent metalloprotease [Granulicella sp.]
MRSLLVLPLLLSAIAPVCAQEPAAKPDAHLPSIATRTAAMQHMPGLLPLDWDAKTGKLYLEIPHLNQDLLYTDSLPYGTGSNDIGLDRGQTAAGRIVRFERVGPKVLLVEPNQMFRTSSDDPAEQLAVRQSFPESILAGFKVEAEDAEGAVLVDATDFFLRDAHNVAATLARTQQGAYKIDPARSTIALDRTRAFPRNTEVEAILTFATDATRPGEWVRDVTPEPHALTLREHQSFIELPGPGFTPRRFDPRAGYFPTGYRDYSAPLGQPLDQQFIIRHRLIKKDPNCVTACEAVQPLQYYVDRGAPEPIRSALVEGARWWDQAFQAAGWAPGTFKVDVLPEGADPMDVRYNIIQWVHRYSRGWSYGAAVTDPRTGEIIKGNVTLGSLRGRQDYLIAEALLSPYVSGKKITPADDPMLQMVLARIRQLAAHETGHTLGLAHNFAASSFAHTPEQSVSVMDYPHPWITLDANGVPDLSHAYATNIGQWDKVAIDYGYRQFPAGTDEHDALNQILTDSEKTGLIYITDEDARPFGGAHPHAHLWDNGTDPADELNRILTIRAAALARFGANAIHTGAPMAQLEDTLVPLYLLHRYQTEATIKEIGGLDYRYQLRGDGQPGPTLVSPAEQRKALAAVLKTLSPSYLTLPEPLLQLLPPRPPGLEATREALPSATGLTFDPVAAAESAADLTLSVLFNPQRASRLVEYHARNPEEPSLDAVLDATLTATRPAVSAIHPTSSTGKPLSSTDFSTTGSDPVKLTAAIQNAVYVRTVEALLTLAANPAASSGARAIVFAKLDQIRRQAKPSIPTEQYIAHRIQQFQTDPAKFVPAKPIDAPPGMPIGDTDSDSNSGAED